MAVSSLWAGTGDQTSGLGTDWTGVSYWTGANDGYYESCTISTLWDSGMSEYFYAYNYGFSIPSTATITKITVDCYCYGSGSVFCNDGHLLHTDRTPKGDGTPRCLNGRIRQELCHGQACQPICGEYRGPRRKSTTPTLGFTVEYIQPSRQAEQDTLMQQESM